MLKTRLKTALAALALTVIVFLVLLGSWCRVFEKNELDTLDLRFRLRPRIALTDKVAIIEIDNATIKQLGQFPFHRGYHAKLIDALAAAGAKAVVFDMFFSEPRAGDSDLREAIQAAGNVYLPYVFELDPVKGSSHAHAGAYAAQNLPDLDVAARGTGYINVIADPDGKFRRVPARVQYQGKGYLPVSLLVSGAFLGVDPARLDIPLDENGNMIVNFAGKWTRSYRHYSFGEILRSHEARLLGKRSLLDLDVFKGKVCLVGYTADGTTDIHPSPLEALYPSIGIHADVFNAVIHKSFISRVPRPVNLGVLAFLLFLVVAVSLKAAPLPGFGLLVEIMAIFLILCSLLFNKLGLWVDVFYPLVAMSLAYVLCTLYRSIAHFKERIIFDNELKNAREIQQSFVPVVLPEIKGFDMAAAMLTAREVGGDLYDVLRFRDAKAGVMIGDVMGKGFPASLFMAMVASSFKFFALEDTAPERTLLELNEKIIREASSNRFVTLFYSVFDLDRRVMAYANGGHLPVLYLAKGREPVVLDVDDGLPLGMMQGTYSAGEIKFDQGDIFVYYTDGITEAADTAREMYGVQRLMAFIAKNRTLAAQALVDEIIKDVQKFIGKRSQQDDITLVVIKV